MKIRLLLVLFLSLLFCVSVQAQEKQVVRVGISNQNFSSWEYQTIKLSAEDFVNLINMSQSSQMLPIEPRKTIEVKMENGLYNIYVDNNLKYSNLFGPLLFTSNADIEILELNRKGMPARYKGFIEIKNAKNNTAFNVINVVDMQNYLRGVVSNEMPISFGLEALKAQSVAARNYATNSANNPNFDVVDSTASQVYYGSNSYNDTSDLAVAQTKGIYALYDEKPITALYFSTSSGITDDWEDVFGNGTYSGKYPYLKPRYDFDNKPLKTERDVEEFFSKKDNGLDTNSPKFRWEYEFERKELEEILHKTLLEQSKKGLVTPNYEGIVPISGLKEIKPVSRIQSGKLTELEVISDTGNYKIKTQLGIRRVFKKNNIMLPSSAFFVQPSKETEVIKKQDDDEKALFFNFSSEDKYPSRFKFIGGGFGHGVGMSQYGASSLAKMGKKYPYILNHYYTDIKISTMPVNVEYNEYNYFYKTEFYYEPDVWNKAYLYINNQRNVNDFPFKINDYEFLDTKDISNKKVIKMDITEYLKEGNNVIVFAPLNQDNKGRHIIYRVEFE